MVSDDFNLTEEILAIMDGVENLPMCCRSNLLKMTAAWERDIVELRAERDKAVKVARYWRNKYNRATGEM